ncbi:TRAP transporter large permease [Geosporobacter ferrireducens]|uniref:TRAP transporter large permease n=1 Tax=Geosporobacter ferrireducens TaxID=1424294 RepID=UPI00235529AB|nr:TRAP transporter large permease [Geosporobacter ferrireducens]
MALIASISAILVLIFIGMSVPFCFLSGSLIYIFMTGASTGTFVSTSYYALDSFSTLAIPLFMIAGTLMEKSGIARTLIDLAEMILKKTKGGMGATIPLVSCFFGALSGSGTATVTTLGSMMAPRLTELGWDKRYLAAFIAACGPLGYMIPPNMNAIIYTRVSSASVAALFLATIIPGILWTILYLIINRYTYHHWYNPENSVTAKIGMAGEQTAENGATAKSIIVEEQAADKLTIIKRAGVAFLMPVIIMGGIYSGIFTATEAGAVGCVYGLIVGVLIFKKMSLKEAFSSFIKTGSSLGSILIMFPMTLIFTRILVLNGVPGMVTQFITGISSNKYVIILIIDLVLILAGCFLDAGVLLLVFTPLLLPTAAIIGIGEIQLGVMMFVAVGVGTITPPMAMNLFITGKITGVEMMDMMKPLLPFLLFAAIPILILVTFVPAVSTFLPSLILSGGM